MLLLVQNICGADSTIFRCYGCVTWLLIVVPSVVIWATTNKEQRGHLTYLSDGMPLLLCFIFVTYTMLPMSLSWVRKLHLFIWKWINVILILSQLVWHSPRHCSSCSDEHFATISPMSMTKFDPKTERLIADKTPQTHFLQITLFLRNQKSLPGSCRHWWSSLYVSI